MAAYVWLTLNLLVAYTAAIWPIPSSYSSGDSVLWIDNSVRITYNGAQVQPSSLGGNTLDMQILNAIMIQGAGYGSQGINGTSASQAIINTAISDTLDTLFNKNFVPWKFHPRNSNYQPPSNGSGIYIKTVTLRQNGIDSSNITKPLDGSLDESYTLTVTEEGEVTVTGASAIGLAYGLNTFTQLFYKHTDGGVYTSLAPVQITDAPKFVHRGLNMDVARSYYAPSDILRTIDALAYNKFNRLHVHVTDSQSWPLEIPALPELARKGAYEVGLSYSPATVRQIQEYGALRGVEVYLEIDMPGHTSSIAFSHPELIAAFNVQPNWDTYAAEPPSGTLKLNSSAVSTFLHTLFDDLLPRIAPYTAYFHTGGDEVNVNAYNLDDTVRSNDTAVLQPLMQAFVDRNHDQVRAAGLTPIVWEEMLLTWNLTLGSDVVVQTWQSDEAVAQTVSQGHKALAGNYNYWVSNTPSARMLR